MYDTGKDANKYSFSRRRCVYGSFQNSKFLHMSKEKRMISSKFTPAILYLDTRTGTELTADFRRRFALYAKNENEASVSVSSSMKVRWW